MSGMFIPKFVSSIALLGLSGLLAAGIAAASPEPARSRVRTTNGDFATHIRPEPDSFKSLGRIPVGTDVEIRDMRVIQIGKFKENWYLVEYDGVSGWVRGDDLEGETAEKNFSVTYQAPDFSTGTTSPGGISF